MISSRHDTGQRDICRPVIVAVTALACAAALAACGSSGKPSNATSASGAAQGIKFAACMRSHGVPNFPDPSGGGGIKITPGSGVDPQSPAFRSAQTGCAKLMPGGGPDKGQGSESRKLAMLRLARCMRSHGVSSFPDPTSAPPSGPPAGGVAFGGGGVFLSLPQTVIKSPSFKRAAAECNFPGIGRGGPKQALPSG